jgi:hypothetical protein
MGWLLGGVGLAAAATIAILGWLLARANKAATRAGDALEDERAAHREHGDRLGRENDALTTAHRKAQERLATRAAADPDDAREYLLGVLADTADALDAVHHSGAPVPAKRDH